MQRLESNLDEAFDIKERYRKQRAKVDWHKIGVRNSCFFHSKTSARKTRNRIKGLTDDGGVWRDSNEDIKRITA
ncbi:hypothetical protein Ddye_001379 [Dipteronia dyeriana]|uniref:Uncharacterized protein n=1 Tax=Dipteronia dyeriana TaxID=168575 RepID=A0AAD9XNU1_9ROSI|nr:hypothetical protein Ddye_001379 [Dipteronia dyeriana]